MFTLSYPFKANMEPTFRCCHCVDVGALPKFRRSLLSSFARRSDNPMDLAYMYRRYHRPVNLYHQEASQSHFISMMEIVRIPKHRQYNQNMHCATTRNRFHMIKNLSPFFFRFIFIYWYIHLHMTVQCLVSAHSVLLKIRAFERINTISDKIILRI
jgi:hypothetical protein